MKNRDKRQIIATMLQAGRPDLANAVAKLAEAALPAPVQDAWNQFQAAKQQGYPSGTVQKLWRAFEQAARKAGINPMSIR